MNEITERVARGAALLDEKRRGWWEFTDLDRLRMSSEQDCVLGQEYGDYTTAWERLTDLNDPDWGVDHGFDAELPESALQDYAALTAAWCELIEARRGGAR